MNQKQMHLGPMPVYKLAPLPAELVACMGESWRAVNIAFAKRRPMKPIADFAADFTNPRTGTAVSKSTVSKWINEQLPAALELILAFERETKCPSLTQWLAHQHGGAFVERELTDAEKKDAELAELRAYKARMEAA